MRRLISFLVLALVVIGVSFYFYQRNIQAVPVSASDLEKGGSFSSGERAALMTACASRIKQDTDKKCGCIAGKVATEFSRFDRMMITASFQERLSDVVGITKGLVQSGIPVDKVKAAEEGNKIRLKEMLKNCEAG